MIDWTAPPTGPATVLRCPRCLATLFSRPEDGTVGCKTCARQSYFVPKEFRERPDRKASWLTVCCSQPIQDFSQMTYVCPQHAFRHILPLDSLDPHIRARAESPSARQQLAGQSRRFTWGLLFAALAFVALAALAVARPWR